MNELFVNVNSYVVHGMDELSVNICPRGVKKSRDAISESGLHGLNSMNGLGIELSLNGTNGLNVLGLESA